jgi:hypothetical protein
MNGTITSRRPRVRGLDARFENRILPLFQRRTPEIAKLLPELYLHGLSSGDFTVALRGLLGDRAPPSASRVQRLTGDCSATTRRGARKTCPPPSPCTCGRTGST